MIRRVYSHINHALAALVMEEALRHGIRHACIAPGSRSTPLTLAAADSALETHCHFDERGLGFMALGMARATGRPAMVITTSGTAVANLYPALIEAAMTGVPMLLVTADRPPELLDCGANQAIVQPGIFAGYPLHQLNLEPPSRTMAADLLLERLSEAMAICQRGPVHINCMLAEPLYPDETVKEDFSDWFSGIGVWLRGAMPWRPMTPESVMAVADENWSRACSRQGVVLVGRTTDRQAAEAVLALAGRLGWPVLADAQSQLAQHPDVIQGADILLQQQAFRALLAQAEFVLQFGARLVSKRLLKWLSSWQGQYWQVDPWPGVLDPTGRVSRRFYLTSMEWIALHPVSCSSRQGWRDRFVRARNGWLERLSAILPSERLTEMTVISELSLHLPQGACLFLGNSLAIRLYDMLARPDAQAPEVMANRGASGIDGLLSTAVGCQLAEPTRPLCLVLGDMSLLHDLNGLALLQQVEGPMVVILLNNGGGSIFRMMPVPENRLEAFYSLPRQVDFASSCAQFGIPHVRPASLADYAGAMHSAWLRAGATVIEICTPPAEATDWLRALGQKEHG